MSNFYDIFYHENSPHISGIRKYRKCFCGWAARLGTAPFKVLESRRSHSTHHSVFDVQCVREGNCTDKSILGFEHDRKHIYLGSLQSFPIWSSQPVEELPVECLIRVAKLRYFTFRYHSVIFFVVVNLYLILPKYVKEG